MVKIKTAKVGLVARLAMLRLRYLPAVCLLFGVDPFQDRMLGCGPIPRGADALGHVGGSRRRTRDYDDGAADAENAEEQTAKRLIHPNLSEPMCLRRYATHSVAA